MALGADIVRASSIYTRRFALMLTLALAACAAPLTQNHTQGAASTPIAHPTVVLVHGAFEDSSVWRSVEERLHAKGFRTVAVDLPGRPGNPLPASQATLALYRDAILTAVRAEPAPVILVGHSFGGIPISVAAEAAPENVRRLIYVAAYLPANGQSLLSLSQVDRDSQMGPHFQVDAAHGVARVEYAARVELFCNDCAPEIAAALPDQMVDEPLAPPGTPVVLTAARFGQVDKAYIHTARDRVVSPYLQALMVQATPVRHEVTLDTGHTPFLSNPAALADAIADLAQ